MWATCGKIIGASERFPGAESESDLLSFVMCTKINYENINKYCRIHFMKERWSRDVYVSVVAFVAFTESTFRTFSQSVGHLANEL